MRVAPCERRDDPVVQRRLLRGQHRWPRNEPQVRRVPQPGLSDPERPRQRDRPRLRCPAGRLRLAPHVLYRGGRPHPVHRHRREAVQRRRRRRQAPGGAQDRQAATL